MTIRNQRRLVVIGAVAALAVAAYALARDEYLAAGLLALSAALGSITAATLNRRSR